MSESIGLSPVHRVGEVEKPSQELAFERVVVQAVLPLTGVILAEHICIETRLQCGNGADITRYRSPHENVFGVGTGIHEPSCP